MTTDSAAIDCQVICDLMIVYASGEASPETVATIEAHLDDCPECREAFEAAQRGEDLLAELEPVVKPIHIDGRKILIRLQRLVFGVLSVLLLLTVIALALGERWIVRDLLGLSLSQLYVLPGGWEWPAAAAALAVLYGLLYRWRVRSDDEADRPYLALVGIVLAFGLGMAVYSYMVRADVVGVLTGGSLAFALYVFMLRFRARQTSGRFFGEILLSMETTVPLLFLILAALTITSSGVFPAAVLAIGLVVFALFFTLLQLDELPYMTLFTLAALFAGGLMLVGNAVGGFVRIFDLTPEWPVELGHPAGDLAEAPAFNLQPYGYSPESGSPVALVTGEPLPAGSTGYVTRYERTGGGAVAIYVIQFADETDADAFFRNWGEQVEGGFYAVRLDLNGTRFREPDGYADHPLHWRLELPGVWFGQDGGLVRAYDEAAMTAYNAWQIDEWVTIIEVDGTATHALRISREVKEAVAEAYAP
jgi:hypothetical protein